MEKTKRDRVSRKLCQGRPIARNVEEPIGGRLNIRYAPENGQIVSENPPRFAWLPVLDSNARYVMRISDARDLGGVNTFDYSSLPWNFLTPDRKFQGRLE